MSSLRGRIVYWLLKVQGRRLIQPSLCSNKELCWRIRSGALLW